MIFAKASLNFSKSFVIKCNQFLIPSQRNMSKPRRRGLFLLKLENWNWYYYLFFLLLIISKTLQPRRLYCLLSGILVTMVLILVVLTAQTVVIGVNMGKWIGCWHFNLFCVRDQCDRRKSSDNKYQQHYVHTRHNNRSLCFDESRMHRLQNTWFRKPKCPDYRGKLWV